MFRIRNIKDYAPFYLPLILGCFIVNRPLNISYIKKITKEK